MCEVIKIDKEKCVNCHACISACPVKYCNDGSGEYINLNHAMCIGCGNCILACTHQARYIADDIDLFIHNLKNAPDIVCLIAPAVVSNLPDTYLHLNGWLKSSGVKAIFDVSFGAELLVKSCVEYLKEKKPNLLIAPPCPPLVSYIQLYLPELLHNLAPVDTPLQHMIKMIKEFYPQYAHYKYVFLSPCIAKKKELEEIGTGNYNVTFKSLLEYLNTNNIHLEDYPEIEFDGLSGETGVVFPNPGGLTNTIKRHYPELSYKFKIVEGAKTIYEYLNQLNDIRKDDSISGIFIDCLNCQSGCNGGTGTTNINLFPAKMENYVEDRKKITEKKYRKKRHGNSIQNAIEKFWKPNLYDHHYENLEFKNTLKQPNKEEIQDIYNKMKKYTVNDIYNCSSCGYDRCEKMAIAIYNKLNRPENCHHYQEKTIAEDNKKLKEIESILTKYQRNLEDLVELRTNELEDSKQILADIIDFLPDPTFAIDKEGKIIFWNKEIEQLTGFSSSELVGKNNYEHGLAIYGKRVPCLIDWFFIEDKSYTSRYKNLIIDDNTLLCNVSVFLKNLNRESHLWAKVTPLKDNCGNVVGAIETIRDIADIKKMEEELIKIKNIESLGFLAGGIAHDFNNLLAVILGNISLISNDMSAKSSSFKFIGNIEKASHKAKELCQQLLTFSKGGMPVKTTASIKDLVKDAALFSLRGSNIECKFEIEENLFQLDIDKSQISQVINNLVINAIQAMPSGGIIEIKCNNETISPNSTLVIPQGTYVRIVIQDYGTGIPEEYLDKIFDPYFSRKKEGSGLGLSICYSVIKKHGGYIFVESKVEFGSTFTIYLPSSQNINTTEGLQEKKQMDVIKKGNGRILVMDDDLLIRSTINDLLERLGYEVEFASNGEEAIKLYSESLDTEKIIDIVIMDLTIKGGMGGKETITELKKINSNVKAIISSGYSDDLVISNYKEYGFLNVILKPYNINQLSSVLHSTLGKN